MSSRKKNNIAANQKRVETDKITAKNCENFTVRSIKDFAIENDIDITGLKTKTDLCKRIKLEYGLDDTVNIRNDPLMRGRPEKMNLKASDATDFLAMIYLLRLHPEVCLYVPVKSALYSESYSIAWYCDGKTIDDEKRYLITPPGLESQLDRCDQRFFFVILTWAPCQARMGIRINFLLFDKKRGKMYKFDLSGSPDSETKEIFKYSELEYALNKLSDNLNYSFHPIKVCSGMGDQASICVAKTIYTADQVLSKEETDFDDFYKEYSSAYYDMMQEVWNASIKTQTTVQAFLIKRFNDLAVEYLEE